MGGGSRTRLATGQPALPRRVPRRPAMESRRRAIQVQAGRVEPTTKFRCHPHWDMIFDHIGHRTDARLARPALGQRGEHQDRGRLPAGLGRLRLPRSLRADPVPLPLGHREQRQEHLPRVLATAGDQGRGQGRQGADQQQRIQRRTGRRDHLRGGREGHRQLTPVPTPASRSTAPGGPLRFARCGGMASQQPNTTHWIQTANSRGKCPVFPGDTRITVIEVSDLLRRAENRQAEDW